MSVNSADVENFIGYLSDEGILKPFEVMRVQRCLHLITKGVITDIEEKAAVGCAEGLPLLEAILDAAFQDRICGASDVERRVWLNHFFSEVVRTQE